MPSPPSRRGRGSARPRPGGAGSRPGNARSGSGGGGRSTAERQRAESARIAATVRRPRTAPDRRRPAPTDAVTRPVKGAPARVRPTGILLRFVSCGLLSLAASLTWRLTLAPQRLSVGSTALGCLFLLSGFVVGGLLWYLRDARLRLRDPELVDDERIIFSFVVFAVVPFLVLALVGIVYVVALVVGAA